MNNKIAVIGCGNWGQNLVRNFCKILGNNRVVLYDEQVDRLKHFAVQYPGLTIMESLESIWADSNIVGVAIATPTVTHAAIAKLALISGKHVLVEKPLATSTDDAKELCELAQKAQRSLVVDHLLLFHPAVQEIEQRLATGELGDLYYLYSQRLNLGVVRSEENALWSLAPHDIAVAIRLLGRNPVRVYAHGGVYLQTDLGIEDVVFVTLIFPDGQVANLHLSWLDPDKVRKITLVGSRKMAIFDDMEPRDKLRLYDKGVTLVDGRSAQVRYGDVSIPNVPLLEPLERVCTHFLECIEGGETSISDGWLGLEVVRVLTAAQKSLELGGKPVELSIEEE
jgi:predicted dehydrogenase